MCMILKEYVFCSPFLSSFGSRSELIYHVLFQLRCGTLSSDRRAAAFVLAYCPCVITKEKNHDEAGSPRKKDLGWSGVKRRRRRGYRRRKKRRGDGVEEKKEDTERGERSETRSGGSRKKSKVRKGEENIKDVARGTRCSEWEGTGRGREEEEEKRSEMHRSDGDVGECSAKGQVVKMKMIEKMKR